MSKPIEIAFRLAAPPRSVPFSLRISTMLNLVTQIGFFVLAFSSPFFWGFVGNADLSWIDFRGEIQRTNGAVARIEDTNASENGSSIYRVHYVYHVNGERFEGVSYSTGGDDIETGEVVTVEYIADNPVKSRIEGLRRAMFGPAVLFVLIFPLLGLIAITVAMRWGSQRNRILERGVAVYGTFKEKNPTNVTVNKRPLWELTFEFTTLEGARHEAKVRTTDTEELMDDEQELLLYDPARPEQAVAVDAIKPLPEFDEMGGLKGSAASAMLRLVLPALVVGGNTLWIWYRF